MSSGQQSRPAIYVDEYHTYKVDLGAQTISTWQQGRIVVRVRIPYDGQLSYGDTYLRDLESQLHELPLGQVKLTLPPQLGSREIQVRLPAGTELPEHIRGAQHMLMDWEEALPDPGNTLFTLNGEMRDGEFRDGVDPDQNLDDLLFAQPEIFANNLLLRLLLWAPDLRSQAQQVGQPTIEKMLLEQENEYQIFIPDVTDDDKMTQALVALANNSSDKHSRLIIGIDASGKIKAIAGESNEERITQVQMALLKAALRCSPVIPLGKPKFYADDEDQICIATVTVCGKTGVTYQVEDFIYRRKGNFTVKEPKPKESQQTKDDYNASHLEISDVWEIGNSDDVIFLDAETDEEMLDRLGFGPAVCGLVNAGRHSGLIVVRNLPFSESLLTQFGFEDSNVHRHLLHRLNMELDRCLPRPRQPLISYVKNHNERISVISFADLPGPVALYSDNGHEWTKRSLRPLAIDTIFTRYLERYGFASTDNDDQSPIQMVYGELHWPIQPPKSMRVNYARARRSFDIQRRAVVWRSQPFREQKGTAGWSCTLPLPLRQALMKVDDVGAVVSGGKPTLEGSLLICFDDVLASKSSVERQPHSDCSWFGQLPVYKRTHLQLHLEIQTQELFARRHRLSLLRFRVPDVDLDADRISDLQHMFADLGFRLNHLKENDLVMTPTDPPQFKSVILRGVRNKGFCDINLMAGVVCARTPLTRELHYQQRIDSKDHHTAQLDIRVFLWATADAAASEIARLHMELHQLISQRLQYLHTE